MSAAGTTDDAAIAVEHFADDDTTYDTPTGTRKRMYQPNWAVIELEIGGYLTIVGVDWYARHRPTVFPAD